MHATPDRRENIFSLAVVFEAGLAIAALLLGWLTGYNPLRTLVLPGEGANLLAIGWGIVAALPMALLFWLMDSFPVGPLRPLQKFMDDTAAPMFSNCSVWQLAVISLMAGIGEELLFRGWLQDMLADFFGETSPAWMALCVGSLLFGLGHAITLTYALLATAMGFYLGWVYLTSGNLLASVATHAVYDFLALAYLVKYKPARQAARKARQNSALV